MHMKHSRLVIEYHGRIKKFIDMLEMYQAPPSLIPARPRVGK